MDENELQELRDPESWEFDDASLVKPKRKPRAVVSVAFPRDDFERVEKYAAQRGMTISELIRLGTFELIDRSEAGVVTNFMSAGGDQIKMYSVQLPPSTAVSGAYFSSDVALEGEADAIPRGTRLADSPE